MISVFSILQSKICDSGHKAGTVGTGLQIACTWHPEPLKPSKLYSTAVLRANTKVTLSAQCPIRVIMANSPDFTVIFRRVVIVYRAPGVERRILHGRIVARIQPLLPCGFGILDGSNGSGL
jgi:hypothetical protein